MLGMYGTGQQVSASDGIMNICMMLEVSSTHERADACVLHGMRLGCNNISLVNAAMGAY